MNTLTIFLIIVEKKIKINNTYIIITNMVKLYGLLIVKRVKNRDICKHIILSGHILIPLHAIYFKKSIKQIAGEYGKFIATKMELGTTKIYTHKDKKNTSSQTCKKYKINITTRHNGLIGVLVTDDNYPRRISLTIIQNILDKFELKYNINDLNGIKDYCVSKFNKECHNILKANKDPSQSDDIYKTQKEVEDIKNIMEENIDKILDRGEKIEDIIERTNELDSNAYDFYRSAKKLACCKIL